MWYSLRKFLQNSYRNTSKRRRVQRRRFLRRKELSNRLHNLFWRDSVEGCLDTLYRVARAEVRRGSNG